MSGPSSSLAAAAALLWLVAPELKLGPTSDTPTSDIPTSDTHVRASHVGPSFSSGVSPQRTATISTPRDHPAIQYASRTPTDRISALARRVAAGDAQLTFDRDNGYLGSVLMALENPIESQVVVFSQTSVRADLIGPRNPRALFFNDRVAVGWVRGADTLELAAHDPQQGTIFYTLEQRQAARPRFTRETSCLLCHLSRDTQNVPGLLTITTQSIPQDKYSYASGFVSDHRTPISERWGGWFVTGRAGSFHLGNTEVPQSLRSGTGAAARPRVLDSLQGLFDLRGFPSAHSDAAALMVLEHQTQMTNLLTRVGWEARIAEHERHGPDVTEEAVRELVDYLLFVDEAPLPEPVKGSSGFAAAFSARGPRDANGRSLRELDLHVRLMRYPCSYMIYSEAFDRLPESAKSAVYRQMWRVLSGEERQRPDTRLSLADRRAVVEILRATRSGLPDYFGPVVK